ncbi:MAG: hypothetical protein ACFB0B_20570 [Thermonemataceae bacterium]
MKNLNALQNKNLLLIKGFLLVIVIAVVGKTVHYSLTHQEAKDKIIVVHTSNK